MLRVLHSLLELDLPLAGHGYELGERFGGERDRADSPDGLSTTWILAVTLLILATGAILVWLNPSLLAKLRGAAPKALILLVIAAPLVAWTVTSRSNEKVADLVVERWPGTNGVPELLVSLGSQDLNTFQFTGGKRLVRIECRGRDGKVVLKANKRWPFIFDEGYDYPHAHQAASREQLQRVDSCRLIGARSRLAASVKGVLQP
jgi:hypothetical protein